MRRTFAAFVALAVLGLALTAWAKDPNKIKDPARAGRRHGQTTTQTPPPPAPAPLELKGTVVKAEATEITVTIKLPADANTKVNAIAEIKGVADLKPGQAVTLTLEGGKVTRVEVTETK